MNTLQVTTELHPDITVIDGQIKTTSVAIAKHFNKRHDNVIQAIEKLECSPEFIALNFKAIEFDVKVGFGIRKDPAYEITRDGFMFLAMGFTGAKAAQWKEAYILAFNRMESQLEKSEPLHLGSLDNPAYLKQSRTLLHDYADACIAAVQSTGAKAPQFPTLADGVIDGLIAEKIRRVRLLVSFSPDFELELEQVPSQSCIIDPGNLTSLKTVLNECVPVELMPDVINAASQKLARHIKRKN